MKFTSSKIPQWAVKQTLLGPLEANAKTSNDLVPNQLIREALNRTVPTKNANQINEDFEIMSSISPTLKNLAGTQDNIKKASVNSTEAIKASMNPKNREDLMRSKMDGTIRPIQTFDDMISEAHSRMQVRAAGRAESLFDNNVDASKFDISQLSRADILAKRQEFVAKHAKKSSEEIVEEQKSRKLGGYDPVTGMHTASFTSAKTAFHTEDDQFDVYKMFGKKTTVKPNSEMNQFAQEIKKNLLDKFASSVKQNNCDWREAAKNELNNRITKASQTSKKIVDDFYNHRESLKLNEVASVDELKFALNQSEFSHRMGLANDDYKKATVEANKKRKAAINKNIQTASKIEKTASVSKPKQDIVNSALQMVAKKALEDSGMEEI